MSVEVFIMRKGFVFILLVLGIVFIGCKVYEKMIFSKYIPVLAYHDVINHPTEETDVSIESFEKQIQYLKKHHYETLSMDEFYEWKKGRKINGKKVVLTFDDGKESFYKVVVPVLEKYNFKGTIFIIESAIGEDGYLTKEQVLDLKENHPNITLASHSYNLHGETAAKSNDFSIYSEDIEKNKENGYIYYAYPFGIDNESYRNALRENDYKLAFLFSPSHWASIEDHDFRIPRVPIYKSNSLFKFKWKLFLKK